MGRQVLVRILSECGLVAWGECFAYGAPLAVCRVVDDELAPLLVGKEVGDVKVFLQEAGRRLMTWGRQGLGMFALSGIELALWDLQGKASGCSVADLLGGACRRRVRAYASLPPYRSRAGVERAVANALARGFTAIKVHEKDLALLKTARQAAGDDIDLMLDVNCAWSVEEAIKAIRELEHPRLSWIEEPVWPPDDYEGLRRARAEVRTPFACGENESTSAGFARAAEACDIIQPSVTKMGGLQAMLKVAEIANARGVVLAPHSYYFGPGLAATLQFIACTLSVSMIEIPFTELAAPLLAQPVRAVDGFAEVSNEPGLGADPDPETLRRYAVGSPG